MSFSLFNLGGGILYHLRALRFSKTAWVPFRTNINGWLKTWNPPVKNLLWVGPSGGYCVDSSSLQGFKKIVAMDTDTLAPLFFRKNHPNLNVQFRDQSIFEFIAENDFNSKNISEKVFSDEPFAVLFSNFLGQAEFLFPGSLKRDGLTFEGWLARLGLLLKTVPWASFHDRISGEIDLDPLRSLQAKGRLIPRDLVDYFYRDKDSGEVFDHSLDSLFASLDRPFYYCVWRLVPKRKTHIIECFFSQ